VPAGVDADVVIVSRDVLIPPVVSATPAGFNDGVGPLGTRGKTVDDSRTVPVKPNVLFSVKVEVAEPPATKLLGLGGVALMLKSGGGETVTVIVVLFVVERPVALTVMV